MKIFLDDDYRLEDRQPPDKTWVIVQHHEPFLELFLLAEEVSMDHDLGPNSLNGHEILKIIEFEVFSKKITKIPIITIHSRNGEGIRAMIADVQSIMRFVEENKKQQSGI